MALSHEPVLRSLQAVDLCAQVQGTLVVPAGDPCPCAYCALRRVDASYLDGLQADLVVVHETAFPGTSTVLDLWEKTLGLVFDPSLTIEQRRARIQAARRKAGGLSKAYFLALATEMGYTISIDRGVMPLRAGIAKAGDAVVSVNRLTTVNPSDTLDLRNGHPYPVAPTPTGHDAMGAISGAQHVRTPTYPSDFFVWTVTLLSRGSNPDFTALKSRFEALKPAYSTIVWKDGTILHLDGLVGSIEGETMRIIDGGIGSIESLEIPFYDYPEDP